MIDTQQAVERVDDAERSSRAGQLGDDLLVLRHEGQLQATWPARETVGWSQAT